MKTPLPALLLAALFAACTQQGSSEKGAYQMADARAEQPAPARSQADIPVERKLIKEGDIEFETTDLETTRKRIVRAVEESGGYIAADRAGNYDTRQSQTFVVRIPAPQFDSFIEIIIAGVDLVDAKNIQVRDVTEEYLDVQARLKTKKELEARYIDLLPQAKSVADILAIEREMNDLRADIESIEGRLQYLENRIAFSTLTVTFYERVPAPTNFARKFRNGFREGWENFIWFFVFLIRIWPFLILGVVGIWLLSRWRKKRNKGKEAR